MKAQTIAIVLFTLAVSSPTLARGGSSHGSRSSYSSHGSTVHVQSHVTKSGTYVPAHVRTAPDHSKYNNWSTKGNVNPYTGKKGTKSPDRQR